MYCASPCHGDSLAPIVTEMVYCKNRQFLLGRRQGVASSISASWNNKGVRLVTNLFFLISPANNLHSLLLYLLKEALFLCSQFLFKEYAIFVIIRLLSVTCAPIIETSFILSFLTVQSSISVHILTMTVGTTFPAKSLLIYLEEGLVSSQ